MMLYIFGGLLLFFWLLARNSFGERFIGYLKWSSLLVILLLFAFDSYMFVETDHFIKSRAVGGDLGLSYSYFNTNTNTTVQTSMYAKQDDDAGNVIAYHKSDMAVMQIFAEIFPYIGFFIGGMIIVQYLWIFYKNSIGEGNNSGGKL